MTAPNAPKLSNPLGVDIFEVVLFLVEHSPYLVACLVGLLVFFAFKPGAAPSPSSSKVEGARSPGRRAATRVLLFLPGLILVIVGSIVLGSWEDAYNRGYEIFKYPSLRAAVENYVATGDGDLTDVLESGKYAPTFGWFEVGYVLRDLLTHTLFHTNKHNEDNIDEGYNKGNDWFESTLGETMMYTSGLFPTGDETLEEAQNYKIDYVANAIELKPDMTVLDVGCGWGHVTKRLTEKWGAKVTGVTLSEEQHAWGTSWNELNGATIWHQDAMKLKSRADLPEGGYDRIVSLEMAEHVGIRRYQEFLKMIRSLLKDDGVFYFQVAGLRRAWRYEDLVWGLFMGEHIFPGADASCPLGWITTQVERAGFEVQRVHNAGNHYSRTMARWLENWRKDEAKITGKYGAKAYRRWEAFLAWGTRASRQGTATLFMLTLTKAGEEGRRIASQDNLIPKDVPRPN